MIAPTLWFRLLFILVLLSGTSGLVTAHYFESEPYPADAEEWAEGLPITVQITNPPPSTDKFITVGEVIQCTAQLHDGDSFRIDNEWFPAHDERLGVGWTVPLGSGYFYPTNATTVYYYAPPYDAACTSGIRDIVLTCVAFDLGQDRRFVDQEWSSPATKTVKVWQAKVEVRQSGSVSPYNDLDGLAEDPPYLRFPPEIGGETLGWVSYNVPAGCRRYAGRTEIEAVIPDSVPLQTGYLWLQQKYGKTEKKVGSGLWEIDTGPFNWDADDPAVNWQDCDSRHPNNSSSTDSDLHRVYMADSPGFPSGPSNSSNIGGTPNWTATRADMKLRSWLTMYGRTISNKVEWTVTFELEAYSGHWRIVGTHTP